MLVLARKTNEKIVIHENGRLIATINLVDLRGDKARIGFEAESCIAIDREEVYLAKTRKAESLEQPQILDL
jgi:carbon storage regulator